MFGIFKKSIKDILNPALAAESFRRRKFAEALQRADAIIEAEPSVAMSHRFKGEVLFHMANYSDCEKSFLRAESLGGLGTEECFFWRALAAANAGEPSRGIEILRQYVSSESANPHIVAKCEAAIERMAQA